MVECSSVNCKNKSENGFRMFRFPADAERRKKWINNCRRDRWNPSANSRLREVHFDQSQFEANGEDQWKKLKQNTIPTLFDVPNPPPTVAGQKGVRLQNSGSVLENIHVGENIPDVATETIVNKNVVLRKREKELEAQLEDMKTRYLALQSKMSSFLTEEQIQFMGENPKSVANFMYRIIVIFLILNCLLMCHWKK